MATSILDLDLPALDTFDPAVAADLWAAAAEASRRHWAARGPIGVVLLRHEDCMALLRDGRFHQASQILIEAQGIDDEAFLNRRRQSILSTEGEAHTRLRKLVSRAFTPRAADHFRPLMREVIGSLVDPLARRGHGDFVAEVSQAYPIPIICALLGAPAEDLDLFSRWAEDVLKVFNFNLARDLPVIMAARAELDAYTVRLIEQRRLDPGEDLLTQLIAAEEEGDRLSHEELVTMAEAVLVAGTDTTRNQLATAIHLFAHHPDQWALLAERPELAATAAEEVLRYDGVVRATIRVATEDVEFKDVVIPKGTLVSPMLGAANRDESVFPEPERFDISRTHDRPQMTLGGGIHYCLGANLARAELQEALALLARRLPDLRLDGTPTWRPPIGIQGPTSLPIRCTPNG
jgi:cytochrome P450